MSGLSAAHPGRHPDGGWLSRSAMRLGHYQQLILLGAVGIGIASDALGGRPSALEIVGNVAFIAWVVAFGADIGRYQRQLCERCISEAPTLDPEGAVNHWRPVLWCHHRTRVNQIAVLAVAGWILYSTWTLHWQPWQYAVDVLCLAVIGYWYFIGYIHRRLHPWCPYCRWDDGGDEEVSPPVPEVPAVR